MIHFTWLLGIMIPVFIGILAWLLTARFYHSTPPRIALQIIIAGAITLGFVQSVYLVREKEVIVIERMGKFNRILEPGLHFIIPFFEYPRALMGLGYTDKIDIRENLTSQFVSLINEGIYGVDLTLLYQIIDPQKALYVATSLKQSFENYVQQVVQDSFKAYTTKAEVVDNLEQNKSKILSTLQEKLRKIGIQVNDIVQFKLAFFPQKKSE